MQVISINSSKTISQHEIAFNLDSSIPKGFAERLAYGNLQISSDGDVLIVKIPSNDENVWVTEQSIITLNKKIKDVMPAALLNTVNVQASGTGSKDVGTVKSAIN